jgi:hemerythrin-like domain-containing protein
MEKILNQNVKEGLRQYPPLEKVLGDFGIGCVTCALGSCMLKDIVEVHNLSMDQELRLMSSIAEIVYPGQNVQVAATKRSTGRKPKNAPLSPPLHRLVEEHNVIKRFLSLVPKLMADLAIKSDECKYLIRESIGFIRNFADAFHHAKEEKVLFGFFDQNSEIIISFLKEHISGRSHVSAIEAGLDSGNEKLVREHLSAYADLLFEHIKKEDEILYPWMDRTLTDAQVGQLFAKFAQIDIDFKTTQEKYTLFVADLEKRFQEKY